MKVFKGTDKNMKCKGLQYEIGVTQKDESAIRCGGKGFHSCEAPFDVLRYYPNKNGNRYFCAEADGKIDKGNKDTKLASSELTLKTEIGFAGLVKAQIEYTRKKAKEFNTNGGNGSNLAGGDDSNLAGKENSVLVCSNGSKVKGGKGSLFVIVNRNINGDIIDFVAKQVDGEIIKADVWYTLKNGKLVEVEEEA